MKKSIAAFLALSLMGSALAGSPAPAPAPQPQTTDSSANHKPVGALPGAASASGESRGDLTAFYVVGGAAVVGAIIIASSGGSHHSGTTGTH